MKKALLVATALVGLASQAQAGSTNIFLDCQSASGRTQIKGDVPGDHAEHTVDFTIDGSTRSYFDRIVQRPPYETEKNSVIDVSGPLRRSRDAFGFTIKSLDSQTTLLRFEAIPSTVRVRDTQNGNVATFSAQVIGADPRPEKNGAESPSINVRCSYAYEI